MTNHIHANAARIRQLFIAALGDDGLIQISDLSTSTNRNGDHSAYFNWGHRTFRISDHSCNTDYRSEIWLIVDMTADQVADYIACARDRDAMAAARAAIRQAEEAVITAARKDELDGVAQAAARRKAAWLANLAQIDKVGMTHTAIGKIEKAWRKANPISAF